MSFYEAQNAFLDPGRIIAKDLEHSQDEKRYYYFGKIHNEVMTIRFTYHHNKIRIIGAEYWRKGKKSMKKHKVKYTNEPIGKVKIISDFLPNPASLVLKKENVKVTLSLSKESVDFFKHKAKIYHTQYQKMIRNLLDEYANHYNHSSQS